MATYARSTLPRDRALAFGAAALAHAIVLFLLLWRLGATPPIAEPPVMIVQLVRPAHSPDKPEPPRALRRGGGPVPTAPRHPTREPDAREAATAVAPFPAEREAGGVQRALRGLLGCQHAALAGLSAEERQRCQDRMAASGPNERGGAFGRLNLDIRGGLAKDPEPYLARRPRSGCKARAAGDVSVMGDQGAAAGVACAWSF